MASDYLTWCVAAPSEDVCGCGPHGICKSKQMRCICNTGFKVDMSRNDDKCQGDYYDDSDDC